MAMVSNEGCGEVVGGRAMVVNGVGRLVCGARVGWLYAGRWLGKGGWGPFLIVFGLLGLVASQCAAGAERAKGGDRGAMGGQRGRRGHAKCVLCVSVCVCVCIHIREKERSQ